MAGRHRVRGFPWLRVLWWLLLVAILVAAFFVGAAVGRLMLT